MGGGVTSCHQRRFQVLAVRLASGSGGGSLSSDQGGVVPHELSHTFRVLDSTTLRIPPLHPPNPGPQVGPQLSLWDA